MEKLQSPNGFPTMNNVLTIFLLGASVAWVAYGEESQSYVVTILKMEDIEVKAGTKKMANFSELKPIKREHFLNGSMKFFEDMDNENYQMFVEMFTSPQGDGVYKKIPMEIPPTGICTVFAKFYRDYLQPSMVHGENTNVPYIEEEGVCPMPAGEYYFKEILLNTDSWPSQIPRGTLKVVVKMVKHFKVVGGFICYLNIEDDTR